jgi:hypothetical protein
MHDHRRGRRLDGVVTTNAGIAAAMNNDWRSKCGPSIMPSSAYFLAAPDAHAPSGPSAPAES